MKIFASLFVLSGAVLMLASCEKKTNFEYTYYNEGDYTLLTEHLNLPEVPYDYRSVIPAHLGGNNSFSNSVDNDLVTLGRVLFYDTHLSKDTKISCASCHKQELAFSDDVAKSKGVFDRTTDRNSLALGSVPSFSNFYGSDNSFGGGGSAFFWDNRVNTAAEQSKSSMTNSKEMDMTLDEIVVAVQDQPFYGPLFQYAFNDKTITEDRIRTSIAAFVNSMGSFRSKFDKLAATNGASTFNMNFDFNGYTQQENRGKSIYMNNCASCHSNDFGRSVIESACNGLDAQTTDAGVGGITGNTSQLGLFKVPTLRNIALTGPYMHDGRFGTLDQVLDHYSNGVQNHPNLSQQLRNSVNNQPLQLNFSQSDRQALISFLHTLTDEEMITDVRFADPFKR